MAKSDQDELVFLPLGGSNEIGMNFNLYGFGPAHDRKWIVVDLGVTFGDQTSPGVEIILPDPTYLEQVKDNLLGIVLTHAHEDHIGAVGWLWLSVLLTALLVALAVDGLPPPASMLRSCGPKANSTVAASSSHGTTMANISFDVTSSSAAPAAPPMSDSTISSFIDKPGGGAVSSRKPHAPAA